MACLDLHYYVTVYEKFNKKRNAKETNVKPVALGDLEQQQNDGEANVANFELGMCLFYIVFINGLLKEVEQAGLGVGLSDGSTIGGMLFALCRF